MGIIIIFWLAPMLICASIAEKQGRSRILAAGGGLLFSWLGVVAYIAMGKTNLQKAKDMKEIQKMMSTIE